MRQIGLVLILAAAVTAASLSAQPQAQPSSRGPGPAESATQPLPPDEESALDLARKKLAQAGNDTEKLLARADLSAALVDQADRHARRFEYSTARRQYLEAFDLATGLSPARTEFILEQLRRLHARSDEMQRVEQLKASLAASPDDRNIREKLIQTLLRLTSDPAPAAELLTPEVDESLSRKVALAQHDANDYTSSDTLLMARWYEHLAGEAHDDARTGLLGKAVACYQRYLSICKPDAPDASAAAQATEHLLTKLAELTAGASDALPLGVWLDLLATTDPLPVPNAAAWTPLRHMLVSSEKDRTMGVLPIQPSGDYEIQVDFVRTSEQGAMTLCFPFAGKLSGAILSLNGRQDVLGSLRVAPSAATTGRLHVLRLVVRQDAKRRSITQYLDGKPYLTAHHPREDFARKLAAAQRPVAAKGILLGVRGGFEIKWIGFKALSGEALVRRRKAAKPHLAKTVILLAEKHWQWVMQVRKGDALIIAAEGTWSWNGRDTCGPEGDAAGWHGLRGRLVYAKRTFLVGRRKVIVVGRDDVLKMEMEDADKSDNTGQMAVEIHSLNRHPDAARP